MKLVIENADLHLLRPGGSDAELTPEQLERKQAAFGILIALFERAYILVYEEDMDKQQRRLWQSWEDYMREWCLRRDFREALPAGGVAIRMHTIVSTNAFSSVLSST